MALDALNSLNFAMAAPAGTPATMPKTLNPTNHMPQTKVGAFILPSSDRISPLPLHAIRTCDFKRQIAMNPDLDHCDRALLARCTNRSLDSGERADRSITGRTLTGRPGRKLGETRSSEDQFAERKANSDELANACEFATATTVPLTCLPPIIGASIAT